MYTIRTILLSSLTFYIVLIAAGFADDAQKIAADKERIIQSVRFLSEENHPRTAIKENKEKTIDYIVKSIADTDFEVTRGEFARKLMLCDTDFPSSSNLHSQVVIEQYSFTYNNIHALKKGKTDKRIVIGAHYDAVSESPGADDNASGVAVLIELAHLLKDTIERNCDIELVFYDMEEMGCWGSKYHAKKLKSQNVDVACTLCVDMVGYYSDAENSQEYPISALRLLYGTKGDFLGILGSPQDTKLLTDAKNAFQKTSPLKIATLALPADMENHTRGDHFSYWQEGYSALFFCDTAELRNKNYHEGTDTWDTLDYDRLAQVPVGLYEMILMIDAANAPE